MDTLAPTFAYRHTRIRVTTERAVEFVDLTAGIEELVSEASIAIGFVNVQSLHTTAAVVVNEHEPLLLQDFTSLLQSIAPPDGRYRHDDEDVRTVNVVPGERANGHAHCQGLLLGAAVCLNIVNGRLVLGRWQRVFLVELDGPRTRDLSVLMIGEGRR